MIVVRLMGGHSNQLFQYAIGRKLAKKHNTELVLDLSWFDDFADVDTPRVFELDCYTLKACTIKNTEGIKIIDPRVRRPRLEIIKRKLGIGKTVWMYYEKDPGFQPEVLELPDNTLLVGYWQTERYFADIRDELLEELEPITAASKKNQQIIKNMKSSESVWMHIRRGDYITNDAANKFHGVKGLEYYKAALDLLTSKLSKEKLRNLSIFVCSNDIDWCKKYLAFDYPVTYFENRLGSDDMRVAKHCRHDILANSSFSWWGAWLNSNPDKIIIAPKRWFDNEEANNAIDIVPGSWIRV